MNAIDIAQAVQAPFKDPDWLKKTLLGLLWTLLVVTIPAVIGAQVEYIRRSAHGDEGLPEWTEFGEKWVSGLLAMVAGIIYFLPVVVAAVAIFVPVAVVEVVGGSSAAGPISGLIAGLFAAGALVYALLVTLFFYAALTHYAMTGRFGAFFEFGEVSRRIKAGPYFLAWAFAWIVSIVAGAISGVLRGTKILTVLVPGVSFLGSMMTGHLLGQYARYAYGQAGQASSGVSGFPQ